MTQTLVVHKQSIKSYGRPLTPLPYFSNYFTVKDTVLSLSNTL